MEFKKVLIMFSSLLFVTTAFAGYEDWQGTYTLEGSKGKIHQAAHTPTRVSVGFIQAKRFKFSKGSTLDDLIAKEDGMLEAEMKVETFYAELSKLGKVIYRNVVLGPTYPVQGLDEGSSVEVS